MFIVQLSFYGLYIKSSTIDRNKLLKVQQNPKIRDRVLKNRQSIKKRSTSIQLQKNAIKGLSSGDIQQVSAMTFS